MPNNHTIWLSYATEHARTGGQWIYLRHGAHLGESFTLVNDDGNEMVYCAGHMDAPTAVLSGAMACHPHNGRGFPVVSFRP